MCTFWGAPPGTQLHPPIPFFPGQNLGEGLNRMIEFLRQHSLRICRIIGCTVPRNITCTPALVDCFGYYTTVQQIEQLHYTVYTLSSQIPNPVSISTVSSQKSFHSVVIHFAPKSIAILSYLRLHCTLTMSMHAVMEGKERFNMKYQKDRYVMCKNLSQTIRKYILLVQARQSDEGDHSPKPEKNIYYQIHPEKAFCPFAIFKCTGVAIDKLSCITQKNCICIARNVDLHCQRLQPEYIVAVEVMELSTQLCMAMLASSYVDKIAPRAPTLVL